MDTFFFSVLLELLKKMKKMKKKKRRWGRRKMERMKIGWSCEISSVCWVREKKKKEKVVVLVGKENVAILLMVL